jgi:hypothetical protein
MWRKEVKSERRSICAMEPIPAERNQDFGLTVARFEELTHRGQKVLHVDVVYSLLRMGPIHERVAAWRITFRGVLAFQLRPRPEVPSLPYPESEAAMCQVMPSTWLREVDPDEMRTAPLYHFVIASADDIYEIAATSWKSARLRTDRLPFEL